MEGLGLGVSFRLIRHDGVTCPLSLLVCLRVIDLYAALLVGVWCIGDVARRDPNTKFTVIRYHVCII